MDETSQQKTSAHVSTARTRPKKRDRSASEERLLNAAEDIFSKHGFKGATTRMIADKAKLNESLIGRYFDGKMGLLFALIEKHIEDVPLDILPYPPQETVREELHKLIDSMYYKHCQKDSEFFKIVISQCLTDAKFLKRIREIIPKKIHPDVKMRLENLATQGKIRTDVDLELFIQTLDTYFHGVMLFEKILMGYPEDKLNQGMRFVVDTYATAIEIKK
ncbi:TetR/AcrR family transcriptional regulator [Bdellovibrio svalbardensis]|uniref:TetR/AcrR family transcriptional regulator n=1 Tax=Bdellovibrio svalbardensis TaxID=2972972 RepID=A0ABT6DFL5_9BACT|nr:TetR/AcrR family transcriptional regulator [Bdellovibrio svalbardensis]MDG0815632.1 TetR/AcrR family transcriptional regulator [Bdellovibrio svalbardensis]